MYTTDPYLAQRLVMQNLTESNYAFVVYITTPSIPVYVHHKSLSDPVISHAKFNGVRLWICGLNYHPINPLLFLAIPIPCLKIKF